MYNFLFLHTPHKVDPLSNGASIAKMCFYLVRCQHKYCWHGERRVIEEHYLSAKECTFRFSHTTHFCRHLSSQWSSLQVNIFDLALVQIHSVLAFFCSGFFFVWHFGRQFLCLPVVFLPFFPFVISGPSIPLLLRFVCDCISFAIAHYKRQLSTSCYILLEKEKKKNYVCLEKTGRKEKKKKKMLNKKTMSAF